MVGLRDPVWDLAQLASGESPEAWRSRRAYKFLDPAHRRIVRWMKASNVLLRHSLVRGKSRGLVQARKGKAINVAADQTQDALPSS